MPRDGSQNLKKSRKGVRLGGRQKGTPNKTTVFMKEAVLQAFNEMGGVPALVAWGKKEVNKKAFYQIAARLIPNEVVGAGGSPLIPAGASQVHIYMPSNGREVKVEEGKKKDG
jgi:hypothetical protein